ncbi:MAG: Outer membrane protein [Mitsuokella multacida]|jgi:outer membrane protein|uniref:OmpH family outer membrane protein n=1 Tax=uncultured Mitsuokella sp. TaxID=453120 RepID=UPI002601282A|nr:OmpH family outer membrane protein [uncultured Mitsuokella sp.]
MKLRKKTVGLLAAAFAATMLMSGCGQVKIGYIEGSRVMQEAPQVKALVDEGNQKINEAREEAQKSLQDNPDMSQEDAQKTQAQAQQKMASLNQSYQMQLQQKVSAALQDIAKEKKLDVVVDSEKEQPTALSGCVDVTDDVIAKLQ